MRPKTSKENCFSFVVHTCFIQPNSGHKFPPFGHFSDERRRETGKENNSVGVTLVTKKGYSFKMAV